MSTQSKPKRTRKPDPLVEMAKRRGYTWAEWKALKIVDRDREMLADMGIEMTERMRQNSAVFDVAAEDRLAAFHANLKRGA